MVLFENFITATVVPKDKTIKLATVIKIIFFVRTKPRREFNIHILYQRTYEKKGIFFLHLNCVRNEKNLIVVKNFLFSILKQKKYNHHTVGVNF
ncbi:MAG: hypothetical protein A2658_02680 [Candidatus Yonathbacteria bacterium RIFCSPHIGHO2_01_FULL_44_19]|nr:MAG: hypothetical protein A2658_02680 [Candidatus Yonathbacteria bacterium RIFCSPHIGHO2_01_FULL_44_19]